MSSSDDIWAGASWATTGGSVAEGNPVTGSTNPTVDSVISPVEPPQLPQPSKRSKVVDREAAPDNGRVSVFVNEDWSQCPRGAQETLLRGVERGDITPIDVMLVSAGSEATGVTEAPGTDDDSPLGMIGRSAERMHNIQAAVKARGGGDIGVADVNIVSTDDFEQMVLDPKNRHLTSSMKAAVNSSEALKMAPYVANGNGENIGFDFGHGKVLAVVPTGDFGGGKDLLAYEKRSFRRSSANIADGIEITDTQRKIASGIVFPPLVSTGGTSIDAHMALIRNADVSSTPPGTPQFVTVAPQGALPSDKAVAATRKKMASLVALTGIGGGLRDSPVILLDGNDPNTRASIDADRMRTVLEHRTGLQPETTDRSDLVVQLEQFSAVLGRDCDHAVIEDRRGDGEGEPFKQERELFLQSAFRVNIDDVVALSKGKADLDHVSRVVGQNLAKAMSQATGRTMGIDITRSEEQRKAVKTVIVVIYLPDDVDISKSRVIDLESAYADAVRTWFGDDKKVDPLVVTYKLPAVALPSPIVALRVMTHTLNVLEMLKIDAPELFEKRLTHHSYTSDKPLHRKYENRIWRRGIEAVKKTAVPVMEKWAQLLEVATTHLYGHRGAKVSDGFVKKGQQNEERNRSRSTS